MHHEIIEYGTFHFLSHVIIVIMFCFTLVSEFMNLNQWFYFSGWQVLFPGAYSRI